MDHKALIRLSLAALAGAFGASVLLGAMSLANSSAGFSRCTATTGAGWTVPLISVLVIGLAGGALFVTGRRSGVRSAQPAEPLQCPGCGGEVRSDWRLCPHCGELL